MSASEQVPAVITTGLIVVSVIFPILSFVAIGFRYKARSVARQQFQADDWWIIASWIFSFSLSVNAWIFGNITGINFYKISPLEGVEHSLLCLLVSSMLLQVSLAVVKISILLFYKRIFPTPKFQLAVWVGIAAVGCWGIIFFFLVLLEGNPIDTSWTGNGVFRFNVTSFGLAQVGTSIALDILVLVFPLPILYGLHMRTHRKVAIGLIFWLGAFCCVAAIIRLVFLHQTLVLVADDQSAGFQTVYLQSKQFIFMILEPNCSIIAACLPCYGPLFAGGRAPESLVRSVRSVFSIRSRGSKVSIGSQKRSQSKVTEIDQSMQKESDSESQIELSKATQQWSNSHSHGQNSVTVDSLAYRTDEELGGSKGITTTRAVDVTRN
ncbi:MAG: hypothetical protein MMC33_001555 [Icmadophila ericetorum]|nr:hypothetical protein [Icmadophila ericetorum]